MTSSCAVCMAAAWGDTFSGKMHALLRVGGIAAHAHTRTLLIVLLALPVPSRRR